MRRAGWRRVRGVLTRPLPSELYVPLLVLALLLGVRVEPWLLRLLGR